MPAVSIGDDGGVWTAINSEKGYARILIQNRSEADGFANNDVTVMTATDRAADAVYSIVLSEGDSVELPNSDAVYLKPATDTITLVRYMRLTS
jgi:hypothetical protein